MTFKIIPVFVAGAIAICAMAATVGAAAPNANEPLDSLVRPSMVEPLGVYRLGTEMVVRDWVLCVSLEDARTLARAGEVGAAEARTAYDGLTYRKACGRFAELLVVLRERLYASPGGSGHDARVFAAEVKLSDDWAAAFVVDGGLPED